MDAGELLHDVEQGRNADDVGFGVVVSRIPPLSIDELGASERQAITRAEQLMGFVANDALTMARSPVLLHAVAALVGAVYRPGRVDAGLKRLIGLVTSGAAGCRYCQGHTAHASARHGVDADKLAAVWRFETSDRFSDAERAALRVALAAGQTPNAVTDSMFDELSGHYDADQQLEIVAVVAMFGFLNRWNSTLASELEALPSQALSALEGRTSPGEPS